MTMREAKARIERWMACRALRANDGNVTAAARDLGLTRQGLYEILERHSINPHDFKKGAATNGPAT